jgi:hypothetical protein
MQSPFDYASKILATLKDTDTTTASFAMRLATVLLDHRASVEAAVALQEIAAPETGQAQSVAFDSQLP